MNSNHREVTYIRITLSRFAEWSIDNVYLQVKDLNPAKRCVLLARKYFRRFETCLIFQCLVSTKRSHILKQTCRFV